MKILIYSVHGNEPAMTAGAIRNVELAKQFYPGWETIFVLAQDVTQELSDLLLVGGGVVARVPIGTDTKGKFWEFWLSQLTDCEAFQVRDCRNRLNARETAAVEEWLESGKPVHVMRDHPLHEAKVTPGEWGALGKVVPKMQRLAGIYSGQSENFSGSLDDATDHAFLSQVVWPVVESLGAFEHDTFNGTQFPECCGDDLERFVGEPFDEHDQPDLALWRMRAAKMQRKAKKACGCRPAAKEEQCPAQ